MINVAAAARNDKHGFAEIDNVDASSLDTAIAVARDALLHRQHADGHWLFELEADCTIPAEYIMMMHFLDEIDTALESKLITPSSSSETIRRRRICAVRATRS
jgi:hypothetical protein